MLEMPESNNMARQLSETIAGKTIRAVRANASPHGFAFYFGDPDNYPSVLTGKTVDKAEAVAGQVEVIVEDARMLFSDGVNIRYSAAGEKRPVKHQLYVEFDDDTAIVCTVQMYGGLWVYLDGQNDNGYYLVAKEKPLPLTDDFDEAYFNSLFTGVKPNYSVKAFLATEQRIPGLGNGVLQDILFNARLNPRVRLDTLTDDDRGRLYASIKQTLLDMTVQGGRDTEKDLFGCAGGYKTTLSNKTLQKPCPVCRDAIVRQAYLGGNVYFCPTCQPLPEK